ncbi:hypothetical protein AUP68_07191 [Ilyonectria robusta]
MRSCPWGPGNVYCSFKEPQYNALSYTWGRGVLDDTQRPEVQSLDVSGTTWRIPRVDPDHFQTDAFHHAIRQATRLYGQNKVSGMTVALAADDTRSVDFIWVDVACIDQRLNSESMLEIGRQATIFRKASAVYIWLNHTTIAELSELASSTESLAIKPDDTFELLIKETRLLESKGESYVVPENFQPSMLKPLGIDHGWLEQIQVILNNIRREPWFTSLWTLQEAFLRKDACLLSQDAVWVSRSLVGDFTNPEDRKALYSLAVVIGEFEDLRLYLERLSRCGRHGSPRSTAHATRRWTSPTVPV